MTTEEAAKISALINSIIVWGGMAERMVAADNIILDRFDRAVRCHNQAADELIRMGIKVEKFTTLYMEQDNAKINA